jgi:hypothetical protein
MSNLPPFNRPFDIVYDGYSIYKSDFVIPDWCNVYSPDNHDEYNCLAIIQPAPELGASKWTKDGKRILIGVYRDQGRESQLQDYRIIQWGRYGTKLYMGTDRPHRLVVGDEVNLFNVNVPFLTSRVISILNDTEFEVGTSDTGDISGIFGTYQPVKPINFFDNYIVFRILPSMKLVKFSEVQSLLAECTPVIKSTPTYLTDINSGETIIVNAPIIQKHIFVTSGNRQQFNEQGKPLNSVIDNMGRVSFDEKKYTKDQNNPNLKNGIVTNEECNIDQVLTGLCSIGPGNSQVYVYDYYGFQINDLNRGPYFSYQNIIYDVNQIHGIGYRIDNGKHFYSGLLLDEFGNVVLGINSDNTLVVRQALLPLNVDQYNVPYKQPNRKK